MSSSELSRDELVREMVQVSRLNSTATVLFHHVIAESLGLNPTDHKCGDIIAQQGPMSAGELAEITGLTTGTITAVLDRLEKARFIQRIPDPNDRRRVLVESIPDRHQELHDIFGLIMEAHLEMLERYTDDELRVILRYLKETEPFVYDQIRILREYAKSKSDAKA